MRNPKFIRLISILTSLLLFLLAISLMSTNTKTSIDENGVETITIDYNLTADELEQMQKEQNLY